jgi:predicted hotdog family 3-hydroxylacyl-ACP dehydratase
MGEMTYPPLDALMAHRAPMILLDGIVGLEATHGTCRVTIREDSPFAEPGGVPSLVGVEYLAQTIAILSGWQGFSQGLPPSLGFLLSVPKYHASGAYFYPGQTLQVTVNHIWGDGELMQFEGNITNAEGAEIASGVLNVFRPENPDQYLDGEA